MNLPSQHLSGMSVYNLQAQRPSSLCQPLCQWAQSHQQVGSIVTPACCQRFSVAMDAHLGALDGKLEVN